MYQNCLMTHFELYPERGVQSAGTRSAQDLRLRRRAVIGGYVMQIQFTLNAVHATRARAAVPNFS